MRVVCDATSGLSGPLWALAVILLIWFGFWLIKSFPPPTSRGKTSSPKPAATSGAAAFDNRPRYKIDGHGGVG